LPCEEFLNESYRERVDIIRKLGFRRPADTERTVQWSIMQCIDEITEACRDLPVAERYEGSNNSHEVLDPSQRFPDLRKELQRLYMFFRRKQHGLRGRPPKMPEFVGQDALCALLGGAPFGDELIVASTMDFESVKRSKPKIRTKTITVVEWDFCSRAPSIRSEQIEEFSKLHTGDGRPLAISWRSLANDWPPKLFEYVQQARCENPGGHLSLERFTEAIGEDVSGAITNIGLTLSMIEYFLERIDSRTPHRKPDGRRCRAGRRGRGGAQKKKANKREPRVDKRKGKITVTDWSRADPAFALASSIINHVWPISRGVPSFNTRGQRRADGRSERELIAELISNVARLVQRLINDSPDFKGPKFDSVCRKNTFLGPGRAIVAKSGALVALILALRTQLVAYWIARSTIFAICDAAYTHAGDDDVRAAAHCVSATVITSLDKLITDRRQYLRFGAARVRSEVAKWFGPVNPDIKRGLNREQRIVRAVLPAIRSRARHLDLYTDLVCSLKVGEDALAAWRRLADWADDDGRAWWKVCSPDPDHFNEVFEPSHPAQKVA
jgi:hypothetical protein